MYFHQNLIALHSMVYVEVLSLAVILSLRIVLIDFTWFAGLVQSCPNSLNFAERVNGRLAGKEKSPEIVISWEKSSE